MSDLSYLETVDSKDVKGFQQPESTGIKLLTIVGNGDDVLDPNNENYIDGAEAGGFLIRTSMLYIPVPVLTIPMEFKQLYAEFEENMGDFRRYVSLEEGRRIAVDPYKWGQKDTKDGKVLQESYIFIVVLPEYDNILCMISFMSSRVPDGEAWFRAVKNRRHDNNLIAPWNQVYSVNTKLTRNSKGRWYLIKPVHLIGLLILKSTKLLLKLGQTLNPSSHLCWKILQKVLITK